MMGPSLFPSFSSPPNLSFLTVLKLETVEFMELPMIGLIMLYPALPKPVLVAIIALSSENFLYLFPVAPINKSLINLNFYLLKTAGSGTTLPARVTL